MAPSGDTRASLARERLAVERVWFDDGVGERATRLALMPLELAYRGVVGVRNAFYDHGVLTVHPTALPTVSVGNLTVGGTGKTPVSAWIAAELASRGARPALVLRGYGEDEPLVHEQLNPAVPVVVAADRVAGVARAKADHGATIAVLDDAFQHRRARRDVDVVLLSADRWVAGRRRHMLPAGPWREPLGALRRASLVVVTRKAASPVRAEDALGAALRAAPGVASAVIHLAPGGLRRVAQDDDDKVASDAPDTARDLSALDGATVLALSAVGDAGAFHGQLMAAGARLTPGPVAFPDHYRFTTDDAARLAGEGARAEYVVCTLKDAVKLGPLWPRGAPPLWYVSQRVVLERGRESVDRLIAGLVALAVGDGRAPASTTV
ncbi:MAG TPA: tetraacyldisaccharide 4'-kinase [Gemmatimonadaceae bacterium]|nr:tetraacyldisaccharide 4'-kinase [Gemmatimonadaceae bacterium]